MGKYFGTDGVRGIAGADLTCELAMKLGRGVAAVLTDSTGRKPRILIGKDTRQSGDMLEAALTAGLCSVGADVEALGVLPTPAVAYLVTKYKADAGVVISASHNPMEFNGIKVFASTGYKLPDEVEAEIEAHIDNDCRDIPLATGAGVGQVSFRSDGLRDYVDHLYEAVDGDLTGLNICIDCANGAAAASAQKLFPRLGARCTFFGVTPDGSSASRRTAGTSTTGWAAPTSKSWKKRWWPAAMTAASPLTGTPTAASPATSWAMRSTATRSSPCCRWPCGTRGRWTPTPPSSP